MNRLFICCLALLALTGCPTPSTPPAPPNRQTAGSSVPGNGPLVAGFPRTLTDSRGKSITLTAPPRRIVSLAPSNTEVLFDLGAGDRIVADTTACVYPPEAIQKPHIGGYAMSLETILAQNPDLVVANGFINQSIISTLESHQVPTLVITPKTVLDVYDSITLLGRAVGQERKAAEIVGKMKARIEAVRAQTAQAKTRPRVLIMNSDGPIYTTGPGTFIDDLVTVAGGANIVKTPIPTNTLSNEQVLQQQPDAILCSARLQARARRLPGWATGIPAVRNNRFFDTSPQATLLRPSPPLAQGVEELARFLHPELFPKK